MFAIESDNKKKQEENNSYPNEVADLLGLKFLEK